MNRYTGYFWLYVFVCCMLLSFRSCWCRTRPSNPSPTAPGGITNIGNTCYINAVLQVMAAFYPHKFDAKRSEDARKRTLKAEGKKIIQAINKNRTVSGNQARAFFNALAEVHNTPLGKARPEGDRIKIGKQGDAHEMLMTLFDALEFPKATKRAQFMHPKTKESAFSKAEEQWNILMVSIPPTAQPKDGEKVVFPDAIDMQRLETYFKSEMVERDWPKKGPAGSSEKLQTAMTPSLSDLPKLARGILPICVKRYAMQAKGAAHRLNTKLKNAASLTIDSKHLRDKRKNASYKLCGFIVQESTQIDSGHYVAWILAKNGRYWHQANDEKVDKKTKEEALLASEEAYILFYKPQ